MLPTPASGRLFVSEAGGDLAILGGEERTEVEIRLQGADARVHGARPQSNSSPWLQ